MTRVWFIRHARTAWNASGRIQGRSDPPLDAVGEAQSRSRRLPQMNGPLRCCCSPLLRARQTAINLGAIDPEPVAALVEMDWGEWEGQRLQDLRRTLGEAMRRNEDRGLDFRPPGGESPRDVQRRLRTWLTAFAPASGDVVAVTHKGVIRAAMAMACGWDMLGKAPLKLDWACMHGFQVGAAGALQVLDVNRALPERAHDGA